MNNNPQKHSVLVMEEMMTLLTPTNTPKNPNFTINFPNWQANAMAEILIVDLPTNRLYQSTPSFKLNPTFRFISITAHEKELASLRLS